MAAGRVLETMLVSGFSDDKDLATQMIDLIASPWVSAPEVCVLDSLLLLQQDTITHKFKDFFVELLKLDKLDLKPTAGKVACIHMMTVNCVAGVDCSLACTRAALYVRNSSGADCRARKARTRALLRLREDVQDSCVWVSSGSARRSLSAGAFTF